MSLSALTQMGQQLFFPPSVAGWPGGQNWLTSGTMVARQNFLTRLLGSQTFDASSWLRRLPVSPQAATQTMAATILQNDVAPASLAEVEGYLSGTGSAALAALSAENYDYRMRGAAYLTMATPAYQLNMKRNETPKLLARNRFRARDRREYRITSSRARSASARSRACPAARTAASS